MVSPASETRDRMDTLACKTFACRLQIYDKNLILYVFCMTEERSSTKVYSGLHTVSLRAGQKVMRLKGTVRTKDSSFDDFLVTFNTASQTASADTFLIELILYFCLMIFGTCASYLLHEYIKQWSPQSQKRGIECTRWHAKLLRAGSKYMKNHRCCMFVNDIWYSFLLFTS